MPQSQPDDRSPQQRENDERLASEPHAPPPEIPAGTEPLPLEAHLAPWSGPSVAVAGIVENGLVKPLDPGVHLPEHAKVIIVAPRAG